MFTTLIAIGIVATQLGIISFIVLWISKSPLLEKFFQYSHIVLAMIFIGAMFGSLIYEYGFGYEPCLLCWYQRIAIFGVGILSLTGDIRKSKLLQKQVFIFSILGLVIAILHNYIDIIPSSLDICGTGVSCLKRYTYEFGYITIPMMSLTVLLSGVLISAFALKNNESSTVLK